MLPILAIATGAFLFAFGCDRLFRTIRSRFPTWEEMAEASYRQIFSTYDRISLPLVAAGIGLGLAGLLTL